MHTAAHVVAEHYAVHVVAGHYAVHIAAHVVAGDCYSYFVVMRCLRF